MNVDHILPPEADSYQMAALLGIGPRSVRDWASRGVLVRGSQAGRYKTFESLRAYINHLLDGRDPNTLSPAGGSAEHDDQHMKRLIKEALAELASESEPARGGKKKKSGVTGND